MTPLNITFEVDSDSLVLVDMNGDALLYEGIHTVELTLGLGEIPLQANFSVSTTQTLRRLIW